MMPRAISRSDPRRLVAIGGGGFSSFPGDPALDRYVLDLSPAVMPRICLLPTASGDPDEQIQRFYRATFDLNCEPSHISLFRLGSKPLDIRARLFAQDIIYVGGGSMVNMLAIWRAHGLPEILYEAWCRGIVLCGISAGSMCWFTAGVTSSFGVPRVELGLGFLPDSNSVHWRSESDRRPRFVSAIADGDIPPGWGVDDGAALFFAGTEMVEAVSARPGAGAWRVEPSADGASEQAVETYPLESPTTRDPVLYELEEYREVRRMARG
jgi:dipeptidase E